MSCNGTDNTLAILSNNTYISILKDISYFIHIKQSCSSEFYNVAPCFFAL